MPARCHRLYSFERQPARRFERHRQRRNHEYLREHADSWRQSEDSPFILDRRAQYHVREPAEFRNLVAGHRYELCTVLFYRDRRGAQLVGVAAVGNRDDDIARVDLSEAAVQGFGGVQERRHRTDRAKNARSIARDVFGLTNSRHMDAAAARLRRSNQPDRPRNGAKIDRAAQRGEFGQRCVEEALDFRYRIERARSVS